MKKVFISIINFNGQENTEKCLQSLEKIIIKDIELSVVVVDNASIQQFTPNSKQFKNFSFKIIRNETNTGFSGGHNSGIKYALAHGVDYIIILNNDTVTDSECVQELVKAAEKTETIGIVSPKIYFSKGSEYHKDRYKKDELGKVIWYAGGKIDWNNMYESHRGVDEVDHGQYDTIEETDFATGCCLLIKKEVIEKVGMFDERYFLYKEDVDLSIRVKRAGYRIVYAPKAFLWHANASSTGGSGSQLQDYFTTRNRLMFGYTYAPVKTKLALFKESLYMLKNGRPWQKRGVLDYYFGKFGKGRFSLP